MLQLSDDEKLRVLKVRASSTPEGRRKSWEVVAEETHHSKGTVIKVNKWFQTLDWDVVRSFPEDIQQLRTDFVENLQAELTQHGDELTDPFMGLLHRDLASAAVAVEAYKQELRGRIEAIRITLQGSGGFLRRTVSYGPAQRVFIDNFLNRDEGLRSLERAFNQALSSRSLGAATELAEAIGKRLGEQLLI